MGAMMKQPPNFDSIRHLNPYGIEYWSARDLMPLLGYGKNWQNFSTAIQKAIDSCRENGQVVEHHFNASIKMVSLGSGAQRAVDDYNLSRLACYLIAMNGNPRKPKLQQHKTILLLLPVLMRFTRSERRKRNA